MTQTVYIFGHKNPDADSICSAIAYAAYKQALGHTHYVAARCGNSNARINAILEYFKVPLPVFIDNVRPRVKDIMINEPLVAQTHFTCAEALEIMDSHNVRSLPVVTPQGCLEGLVSIFDLSEQFIPKPKAPSQMRHVTATNLLAIARTLHAEVLHWVDEARTEDLFVRVAAADSRTFGNLLQNKDIRNEKSVVVVGDRRDIQEKAIRMNVRLLLLSGQATMDPDLLQEAKAKGVSVMCSQHDSATTGWLVKAASLIQPMIDHSVIRFNEDDTLAHVKKQLAQSPSAPIYMVVGPNNELRGAFTKSDLIKPVQTRIVLVDHNELSQAVDGASEVNVLEIIDHHRLGNMPTEQPIVFYNEPVGSTCTLIAKLYQQHNLKPEPAIAGLLMGGMIADTLLLQSPTTSETDRALLPWLETLAGVSARQLADIIFSTGSLILSTPAHQVIQSDCKVYTEGKVRYAVAQVEEVGFDSFWGHAESLYQALEQYRSNEGLLVALLLVTDINTQNSLLMVCGDTGFIQSITYPERVPQRVFDLPGIVSRKKQLMPYVTQLLKGLGLQAD